MIFDILTIFPDLFDSPLKEGIIRRALEKEQIGVNLVNIRDFTDDPHQMTDDRPFGGGEGMVMKPEPLTRAVASCKRAETAAKVILLSPQGRRYSQKVAEELAGRKRLILVCGRYEGVDQRFLDNHVDEELSIGDFILTGGELAAMVIVDSITRILPGVLGCAESATRDTFNRDLLKHPQYTRPRCFENNEVPADLLVGNHSRISDYRFTESVRATLKKRPDLLSRVSFSSAEKKLLQGKNLLAAVEKRQAELEKKHG